MTLEKPSKNPRNPRNIKDFGGWRFCSSADDQELRRREAIDVAWCDWFESLLEALSDLGAPFSLPSDDVLCVDLDQFIDVPMARRRRWLTKAKRELVQRHLHQCVMDIWEAASERDGATVTAELGSFLGIGAPPGYADIDATFYGKRLSTSSARGQKNIVKIGFTTSLRTRLSSLRTACPHEPHWHLVAPGTPGEERELHRRFAADRMHRGMVPAVGRHNRIHRRAEKGVRLTTGNLPAVWSKRAAVLLCVRQNREHEGKI